MDEPAVSATHAYASSGSALLYVLVALAVVLPASVGLARAISTAKIERELRRDEQLMRDLLLEADAPIANFLTTRAKDLVLPADAKYPAALVADESFAVGGECGVRVELKVVAWDQCGLVAMKDARGATAMRLALPRAIVEVLDRHRRKGALSGLDWFKEEGGVSPFPPTPQVDAADDSVSLTWPASTSAAIGAYVATHNPGHLNVSTAPIETLEAALRDAGRGGLEEIVAARREGRRVPIPSAASVPASDDATGGAVGESFVSTSDAFAFRVDVRVGRVRRSVWLQYRPNESRWRRVQRIDITD